MKQEGKRDKEMEDKRIVEGVEKRKGGRKEIEEWKKERKRWEKKDRRMEIIERIERWELEKSREDGLGKEGRRKMRVLELKMGRKKRGDRKKNVVIRDISRGEKEWKRRLKRYGVNWR